MKHSVASLIHMKIFDGDQGGKAYVLLNVNAPHEAPMLLMARLFAGVCNSNSLCSYTMNLMADLLSDEEVLKTCVYSMVLHCSASHAMNYNAESLRK